MAVIYLATAMYGSAQSTDAGMTAIASWTLAEEGTLDLSQFADVLEEDRVAISETVEVDGHLYTNRFPGTIFLAAPFYLVFPGPFVAGGVAAAVVTALMVGVLYLALARLVDDRTAAIAAAVFGLSTATWSVSADALWTHGPAQLWLALAMWAMARQAWATSGIGFGLALFTRPHLGTAAAVAGLWSSWEERDWRPAVKVAATTALGLAVYLVYTRIIFGQWTLFGGYGQRMGDHLADRRPVEFVVNAFWTLFHPLRGVFVYLPAAIWLVPKARAAWRVAPLWVRSSALAGVGYFVTQAWINRWSGGDGYWTYRYPLESMTLLVPLALLAYMQLRPDRRRIVLILLALSIGVQGAGAIFDLRT
jgi:alpha-1,2-mannosyltransferase